MQFGLIGYPLSHSFSYGYFGKKFADSGLSETHSYQNFPLANIAAFPALLKENPALRGLNVTIPYKEAVIPYLDELSPGAAAIGAVNTILFEDGRLIGYNTDVIGFRDSLEAFLARSGGPAAGALVLGTGGAAKAVAWVLEQMQVPYHYVSRRKSAGNLTYEELDEALLKPLIGGEAGILSLSIERAGLHDAFVEIAGEAAARALREGSGEGTGQ